MPGFFEFKSFGWAVKGLFASFVLVFIGGTFTIYHQLAGPSVTDWKDTDFPLKCTNPDCDYAEVISAQKAFDMGKIQFDKLKVERPEIAESLKNSMMGSIGMMPGAMPTPMGGSGDQSEIEARIEESVIRSWGDYHRGLAFNCSKCGQDSVFKAIQCGSSDCDEIFFRDYVNNDDSCPKCDYSASEARNEELRKKKQDERENKKKKSKKRRTRK